MKRLRAALVLVVLAGSGCALGDRMIVGRDHYRLYRQTRLAPTLEARLAAGNRYLHEDPRGPYAEEVRAWFSPLEKKYVEQAHDSLPMLKAYLAAMPDGPSAKQVGERALELESAARFAEGRKKEREEKLESMESGFERAAVQRKAFVQELSDWLGRLAKIRSYGQPFDAPGGELAGQLGVADPAACPGQICSKAVERRFAIPHGQSRLIPRDASFFVEVAIADGRLSGARVRGRELFSRVGEALDLRAVSFADPLSRAEGIGRALSVIVNALGPELSAEACERPAVSPIVLERSCDGVRLTATAALASGEDDIVMFEPETPPAPPASAAPRAAPAAPRAAPPAAPTPAPSAAPPKRP
ncbi:MAG TPA: hypothetical protein VGK73_07885 [Polyangiaceae bacterium]